MKKITLIGDSIRSGYQKVVSHELSDFAEIWGPDENCRHSIHHLFNLAWFLEQPADLIHMNCGLWDCRRINRGHPENVVPVELYVRNIDSLFHSIRQHLDIPIIWATTTPIIEERYNGRFSKSTDPYRIAKDNEIYNRSIAHLFDKYDVTVNDLYTVVLDHNIQSIMADDGIHFKEEGYQILGEQVTKACKARLA